VDRRTLLTVSTAACLCGMYEAYALFVSPLFSPQQIREPVGPGRGQPLPKPPENRRQAEKHLSDQEWASDSPYQFRTESGFFYFREWEKIEQTGKIRFHPFAMIWWPKGSDPEETPYTIVSDAALVEFAQKFEITNPHPGRVVGGALEGKVRIRGPKDLSIDGRNFNFAEKATRIWSDHKVAFQQGPHTGRGQGLELELIPAIGPPDNDKPAVTGVRTVRLRKDVQMEPSLRTGRSPARRTGGRAISLRRQCSSIAPAISNMTSRGTWRLFRKRCMSSDRREAANPTSSNANC
jgi:hypothetical protein